MVGLLVDDNIFLRGKLGERCEFEIVERAMRNGCDLVHWWQSLWPCRHGAHRFAGVRRVQVERFANIVAPHEQLDPPPTAASW